MWQHYANAHQSRNTQLNNDHTSLRNKHATKQLNDHTSLRGIHNSSSVHALSTSKNKTNKKNEAPATAADSRGHGGGPAGGATGGRRDDRTRRQGAPQRIQPPITPRPAAAAATPTPPAAPRPPSYRTNGNRTKGWFDRTGLKDGLAGDISSYGYTAL